LKAKINQDSWLVSIGLAFAWLVTSVLAVISGLYIREAVLSIASLFQVTQEQGYKQSGGIGIDFTPGRVVLLFDNILLVVLGIGMVAIVIWIEYFFRKGRPQGLLLKRIGIVAGIEVAIIVVSIVIRLVV
jgi:hypothetical protein